MAIGLSKWFKETFLGVEEKVVRNRTKKGRYVADDKSTPNINEAYKTINIKKKKTLNIKKKK
jgi:hypothetical protein|tara:strand:+ start:546 stop:731 length:186 start_codon:yes stop_codon:yes gene_type:complete